MIYVRTNSAMRRGALVIALLLCSLQLSGGRSFAVPLRQPDSSPATPDSKTLRLFELGEELIYEAEFSRALLRSIDVADFRFTAKRVSLSEASQLDPNSSAHSLKLDGEIKSKGFFSKLFNLNFLEQITSIVDPNSFAVQHTKKFDQQGKRVRASETIYDRAAGKVVWTEHDPRDPSREPRVVSSPLPAQVQDILSAVYFLRTQQLAVGNNLLLKITDSGRVYEVPVRIAEKKRIKTVLGKVETIRADVDLFGATGMVGGQGQFSVWLTSDERRIPVRARIKHEYGTFDIKLKKMVQNREPSAKSEPVSKLPSGEAFGCADLSTLF